MTPWPLFRLLADGEYHSGEKLGEALGVSRAAIWKYVQLSEAMGISVESLKGKGYRIRGGLDLLCREQILNQLSPGIKGRIAEVDILDEVESTNTKALSRAQRGGGHGYICLTEWQTAGRGRLGRAWVTTPASNICMSLIWEFKSGVAALEGLSLVVGLAVQEALQRLGATGVGLKWPNDLYSDNRKLGGILIELMGDVAGPCQVIIGLGLNCRLDKALHVDAIDQPWIDLAEIMGVNPQRNVIVAAIIDTLVGHLCRFEQHGFAAFQENWQVHDIFYGKEVCVHDGGSLITGVACGVTPQGALRVEVNGAVKNFYAGEVSLRRLA